MLGLRDHDEADRRTSLREEGEPLDGGITNEVYDLGESVGKIYPRFSWNLLLPTVYRARYLDPDVLTREKRLQNEEAALEDVEEAGFRTPELEERGDTYAVWEKVDGDELDDIHDINDIYDAAKTVGENLETLHEQDKAMTDNRYENYFIEDGDVTSIDHEMFTDDAADHDKDLDIYMWISSIKRLDEDAYRAARDGFFDGYGDDGIMRRSEALTTGMALGHSIVEWDADGLRNVVSNAVAGKYSPFS